MKINDANYYQGLDKTNNYKTKTSKYGQTETEAKNNTRKSDIKTESDVVEISAEGKQALENSKSEKTSSSSVDRSALIKVLKDEEEAKKADLLKMFRESILKQATNSSIAENASDDDVWKFIASGNYTVTEAAKADAQKAISEDGYFGVKQTSSRIFDFAMNLAGGDTEKMKEMQKAIEKGFAAATGSWGKELPSICQDTHQAITDKFDEFYKQNA